MDIPKILHTLLLSGEGIHMGLILLMLPKDQVTDECLDEIQSVAPGKKLLLTEDRQEIEANSSEIEIASGWVPRELIRKFSNLRWLQQWGAGADWLMDNPDLVERDYILTNTSGLHAIPISEHIFALILALARDLPGAVKAQAQRYWLRHEDSAEVFELAGKTMLLVGVGAIGARTAVIANAMGMRVLGVRRNPDILTPGVERMYGPAQLLQVLPEADFVVLTIPLTPETYGIIGEAELKVMKPSAYVINIGRGKTIQEDWLIRALRESWIAGAGLDVFEKEPLPAESPLVGNGQRPHYLPLFRTNSALHGARSGYLH
jgi:phosphoglycerate dehydrogenase-like enzyme